MGVDEVLYCTVLLLLPLPFCTMTTVQPTTTGSQVNKKQQNNAVSREPGTGIQKFSTVTGKGSSNYPLACAVSIVNIENFVGVDCCKETLSVKSAKHSYEVSQGVNGNSLWLEVGNEEFFHTCCFVV